MGNELQRSRPILSLPRYYLDGSTGEYQVHQDTTDIYGNTKTVIYRYIDNMPPPPTYFYPQLANVTAAPFAPGGKVTRSQNSSTQPPSNLGAIGYQSPDSATTTPGIVSDSGAPSIGPQFMVVPEVFYSRPNEIYPPLNVSQSTSTKQIEKSTSPRQPTQVPSSVEFPKPVTTTVRPVEPPKPVTTTVRPVDPPKPVTTIVRSVEPPKPVTTTVLKSVSPVESTQQTYNESTTPTQQTYNVSTTLTQQTYNESTTLQTTKEKREKERPSKDYYSPSEKGTQKPFSVLSTKSKKKPSGFDPYDDL